MGSIKLACGVRSDYRKFGFVLPKRPRRHPKPEVFCGARSMTGARVSRSRTGGRNFAFDRCFLKIECISHSAPCVVIVRSNGDGGLLLTWKWEVQMRHLFVWAVEFIKFLGGRRLHPLLTQCPICQQTVRLHVNKAGRRHVFTHARSLYEGCRLCVHFVARVKCLGSGTAITFDPRPDEHQRFKLPDSLLEE